jgi:hypothetical protein
MRAYGCPGYATLTAMQPKPQGRCNEKSRNNLASLIDIGECATGLTVHAAVPQLPITTAAMEEVRHG